MRSVGALTLLVVALSTARLNGSDSITENDREIRLSNEAGLTVVLSKEWGGTIVHLSLASENFVNAYDPGREVQVAFYDGNPLPDGSSGAYGWDPVQGGDEWGHGSPLVAYSWLNGVVYTKTHPLHWHPASFGGGPEKPVLSDVYIEQWIRFLPQNAGVVHGHWRLIHFGEDFHRWAGQETPAIYLNAAYRRIVAYAGNEPWTNAAVTIETLKTQTNSLADTSTNLFASERWAAAVDGSDRGLMVFVPGAYPSVAGAHFDGSSPNFETNYFRLNSFFEIQPLSAIEGDYYLLPGKYQDAREKLYSLRNVIAAQDFSAPTGNLEAVSCVPLQTRNEQLFQARGTIILTGWAADNDGVREVRSFLNGVAAGTTTPNQPRPDVVADWPGLPGSPNFGFRLPVDTRRFPDGIYQMSCVAYDHAGNKSEIGRVIVNIHNAEQRSSPGRRRAVRIGRPVANIVGDRSTSLEQGLLFGWAFDPDLPWQSVEIRVYVDGPVGTGTFLGSVQASLTRTDVNSACGVDGAHGFQMNLPVTLRDGSTHRLYVYGVDIMDSNVLTLIRGQPLEILWG